MNKEKGLSKRHPQVTCFWGPFCSSSSRLNYVAVVVVLGVFVEVVVVVVAVVVVAVFVVVSVVVV